MRKSSDWAMREEEKRNGDDGYDKYLADLEIARAEAEYYIRDGYENKAWFNDELMEGIWYASTEILPKLEVQVVIDGKNDCYVTTGSSGYVEFGMKPPVGMSLPIKCWIHTHPFGAAYFSGVDWGTVNVWKSLMQEAYVLGGVEHYGYWHNSKPDLLMIRYLDENGLETFRGQVQNRGEEE